MFEDEDDFSGFIGDGLGEALEYKNTYNKLDIEVAKKRIENSCKKFVISMAAVYAGLDIERDFGDEEHSEDLVYITKFQKAAIQQAKMEIIPLRTMMYQVKLGEHVLESLIVHLNAGGASDDALYKRIAEAQSSLSDVTKTLYKHMRSIPTFFKELSEDMTTRGADFSDEEEDYDDYEEFEGQSGAIEGEDTDEEYTMLDSPQRGQGAVLDKVREIMEAQKAALEVDNQIADGIDVTQEGNVNNNPLREEDGSIDSSSLL